MAIELVQTPIHSEIIVRNQSEKLREHVGLVVFLLRNAGNEKPKIRVRNR